MVILYVGSGRLLGVAMTGGTFVLFLEYTRQAFWPLAMFAEQIGFIQRAFASADRVFDVLDTPSRTPDRPGGRATRCPTTGGRSRFENVGFAYDGGTRALDDVSFTIRRGERVALVGLSGGGKTTLTNLLLRYYEPTEGRIALDGVDIRDFTPARLARPDRPRPPGHPPLPRHRRREPARAGRRHRARGPRAGRRHRRRRGRDPGAARRLRRDRSPRAARTSRWGSGSCSASRAPSCATRTCSCSTRRPRPSIPGPSGASRQSIDRLLAGRTSLIIAHRLATVVNADRILVVHQGRIVEQGTHAELYAHGGHLPRPVRPPVPATGRSHDRRDAGSPTARIVWPGWPSFWRPHWRFAVGLARAHPRLSSAVAIVYPLVFRAGDRRHRGGRARRARSRTIEGFFALILLGRLVVGLLPGLPRLDEQHRRKGRARARVRLDPREGPHVLRRVPDGRPRHPAHRRHRRLPADRLVRLLGRVPVPRLRVEVRVLRRAPCCCSTGSSPCSPWRRCRSCSTSSTWRGASWAPPTSGSRRRSSRTNDLLESALERHPDRQGVQRRRGAAAPARGRSSRSASASS